MSSSVTVTFDAESHPADVIQRAAYKYSDRFSTEVQRDGANFRCLLHFPSAGSDDDLVHRFRSEVLDEVLRNRIRRETEGLRNLVLAVAFSQINGETEGTP